MNRFLTPLPDTFARPFARPDTFARRHLRESSWGGEDPVSKLHRASRPIATGWPRRLRAGRIQRQSAGRSRRCTPMSPPTRPSACVFLAQAGTHPLPAIPTPLGGSSGLPDSSSPVAAQPSRRRPIAEGDASFQDLAHEFLGGCGQTTAFRKLLPSLLDLACQPLASCFSQTAVQDRDQFHLFVLGQMIRCFQDLTKK